MMNKRGEVVLRNIIMIIIIFSGVIALASVFVQEMGNSYENTNMTTSYNQGTIGETELKETANKWEDIGQKLDGNLFELLVGTAQAAKEILTEVILAPNTFGNMIESVLEDIGVEKATTQIFGFIVTAALYIVIIFVVISSMLKGGKM